MTSVLSTISFINLTIGSTEGSGAVNVVARCQDTEINYYDIDNPYGAITPAQYVIRIDVNLDGESSSYDVTIPTAYNNELVDVRVIVARSDVELSSFGG